MKIGVFGLWHLGMTTAAGLAALGFDVVGVDDHAPEFPNEPRLDYRISEGKRAGNLRFSTEQYEPAKSVDLAWIAYDMVVTEEGDATMEATRARVENILFLLRPGTIVWFSTPFPVGTTSRFAKMFPELTFVCSPENIRRGKAMETFLNPDRMILGCDLGAETFRKIGCLEPIFRAIMVTPLLMSWETAEMTKHALNSYLAMNIAFANEIAAICEKTGADMETVTAALRADSRVGPKAYVQAGPTFSGGTLARDVRFLNALGDGPLLASILPSKAWHEKRKLN